MSSGDPRAPGLLAQLELFRRRLILVAFVKRLPFSAAIAVSGAMVIARIGHLPLRDVLIALAIGSVVAALAVALIAYRRTGGLVHVAATLDMRFALANSVATALEFSGHDDSVARLIAADADVMLRRRRPQDLPFEAPRHFGWIAAALATVVVAFAFVGGPPSDGDVPVGSQGVLGAASDGSPSSGRSARASQLPAPGPSDAAARVRPADAAVQRGSSPVTSNRAVDADDSVKRQTSLSESASQSAAGAGEPRRPLATDAARTPARPNGAGAGQTAGRGGLASANSGSRGDLGGGAGADARRSTTGRAGGVRGTTADSPLTAAKEASAVGNRAARSPSAAWDRAESAIEREHLPLELRTYVHDYFVAIKSGGLP